jgi:hypothetical protein
MFLFNSMVAKKMLVGTDLSKVEEGHLMVLLHGEDKCSKWIHESLEMILQAFVKGVFTCFFNLT